MAFDKRIDEERGLAALSDLKNFEVADDDPDVRGWAVFSGDGKRVGEVIELIVDPTEMRVRYLDIKISGDFKGVGEDRRLLIPIGVASLDEKEDRVYVKTMETVTILKYPDYSGKITRDYESNVRKAFSPSGTEEAVNHEQDFYEHDHFNDDNFYGSRRKKFLRLSDVNIKEYLGSKPDVRGWDIVSREARKVGRVNEVILDSKEKRILYLDIILSGTVSREYKHILIPIGLAAAGEGDKTILIDLEDEFLTNLPTYDGSNITREYEFSIFNSIERGENYGRERDLYSHKHYDNRNFFTPLQ